LDDHVGKGGGSLSVSSSSERSSSSSDDSSQDSEYGEGRVTGGAVIRGGGQGGVECCRGRDGWCNQWGWAENLVGKN
jgi:hypothetical protein